MKLTIKKDSPEGQSFFIVIGTIEPYFLILSTENNQNGRSSSLPLSGCGGNGAASGAEAAGAAGCD